MTIEKRSGSSKQYFYEAHREGPRVVKTYVGSKASRGVATIAAYDEVVSAGNKLAKTRRRQERDEHMEIEETSDLLAMQADVAINWQEVIQEGIRRSMEPGPFPDLEPGEWGHEDLCCSEKVQTPAPPSRSQFAKLCEQAESGDAEALAHYRHLIVHSRSLLSQLTDLVSLAKRQTVDAIAGESIVVREAIELQLKRETETLLGESGNRSMMDRMLGEVVLLDRMNALRCHVALSRTPENRSEVKFWTSASIAANRRFERAVRRYRQTLATPKAD